MKTKTAKITISDTKVYEMMDGEGEAMGLLKTNLPMDKLESEWKKHYADESREEWGVSLFVEEMKEKYKTSFYTFERIWCEATIYP